MLYVIKLLFAAFMVASSANFLKTADHDDKIKIPRTIVAYVKISELEAYRINAEKIPLSAATGSAEIGLLNAPMYDDLAHTSIRGGVSYTASCQTFQLRGTTTSNTRCQFITTFEADDAIKSSVSFVSKANFVDEKLVPGQVLKYRSVSADGVLFGLTWDVAIEVLPGLADIKYTFTQVK